MLPSRNIAWGINFPVWGTPQKGPSLYHRIQALETMPEPFPGNIHWHIKQKAFEGAAGSLPPAPSQSHHRANLYLRYPANQVGTVEEPLILTP